MTLKGGGVHRWLGGNVDGVANIDRRLKSAGRQARSVRQSRVASRADTAHDTQRLPAHLLSTMSRRHHINTRKIITRVQAMSARACSAKSLTAPHRCGGNKSAADSLNPAAPTSKKSKSMAGLPKPQGPLPECPRCTSGRVKFCYYNNCVHLLTKCLMHLFANDICS